MSRRPDATHGIVGLGLLCLVAGPLSSTSLTAESLEVEWAGCADVLGPADRPTCELDPDDPTLRVWTRTPTGAPAELVAGARAAATPEPIQGGWFWRLDIDPGADALTLRAPTDGEVFTLRLAWRESLPALDGSRELRAALHRARAPADRIRLALALADLEPRPDRAAALFRQVAWLADDRAGHPSRLRARIHALTRRHHLLYSALDDPVGAQRALDALPEPPRGDATSALIVAIFRAAWDIRLGRLGTALRTFEDAERRAERLRDPFLLFTRQPQAHLASRLGLFERALDLVDTLRRQADELTRPCRRSDLFTDLAWSQLLILESVRRDTTRLGRRLDQRLDQRLDPNADLQEAARLAEGCPASLRANTLLNLALGHLAAGRLDEARANLRELDALDSDLGDARARSVDGLVGTWRLEVAGRLALAESRADDALAAYDTLADHADRRLEGDAQWRAAIGRAQALRALGRVDEALAAFAAAEDLLDRSAAASPLLAPRGPESAFVFFERGSRLHLDLLIATGRERQALDVARRSRRRALAHLAHTTRLDSAEDGALDARQRQRARLAANRRAIDALVDEERDATGERLGVLAERRRRLALEQEALLRETVLTASTDRTIDLDRSLATPRPGELLLTVHPAPDGWLGFALLDDAIEIHRLSSDALEQDPAAALLEPFAEAIRHASSLRVLPYGRLWAIDVHALPFDGGLLLDHLPIVYALDLPPAPATEPTAASAQRALVVEDPRRSLRHAAAEARQVASRLERAGWTIDRLGAGDATPTTVRAACERGDLGLVHWAGHIDPRGTLSQPAGLLFDHGRRLGLADLLSLERAPRRVVLSACSALPTDGGRAPVHLGVGQAFVLAGSDWVLGPTGPLDDADAAALTQRFYAAWLDGARQNPEPGEALRRAQLALRTERPDGDWRRFRLLVR